LGKREESWDVLKKLNLTLGMRFWSGNAFKCGKAAYESGKE